MMSLKNSEHDKSTLNPNLQQEVEEDDEKVGKPPIDREFEIGMVHGKITEPKLLLPNIKD